MKRHRILLLILLLSLVLRVLHATSLEIDLGYYRLGGDATWYLAYGEGLVSGLDEGFVNDYPFAADLIPTAPLYLMFVGLPQLFLSDAMTLLYIRLFQAVLNTALCYFLYRIVYRLTLQEGAALLAALMLAVSPVFILNASFIQSETLYLFFTAAGLTVYMDRVLPLAEGDARKRDVWRMMLAAGVLFGLATLTRAVLLLFPVGIAGHFLFVHRRRLWRVALAGSLIFLLAYSAVLSTWTIYNLARFDRFVIVSNQFLPALWRGAVTTDGSPEENDAQLIDEDEFARACEVDCNDYQIPTETYVEKTGEAIFSDIPGYLWLRLGELARANLQPYAITELGGESLRDLVAGWSRDNFSFEGFLRLINGDHFPVKLFMYVFHFVAMIAGLVGMWFSRKRWQYMFVPAGFILYTLLLHVVLLAEPRYMFPTQFAWYAFAAVALYSVVPGKWRQRFFAENAMAQAVQDG